jgi:hypothetical protein
MKDTSWRHHVLAFDLSQTLRIRPFCFAEDSSMLRHVSLGIRGGASWHYMLRSYYGWPLIMMCDLKHFRVTSSCYMNRFHISCLNVPTRMRNGPS